MNRRIGYDNRLCYEREILRKQKIHRERLKEMKSTSKSNARKDFDNTSPPNYDHLKRNEKKKQMYKQELDRIAKANELLTSRMQSIFEAKPTSTDMEFIPGVRIGSSQNPVIDNYLSSLTPSRGCAVIKPSLNLEYRTRERERVLNQNFVILERINKTKPYYDTSIWENERKDMEGLIKYMRQDGTIGHLPPKPSTAPEKTKRRRVVSKKVHLKPIFTASSLKGVDYQVFELQTTSGSSNQDGFKGFKVQAKSETRWGELILPIEKIRQFGRPFEEIQPHETLGFTPRVTQLLDPYELEEFLLHVILSIRVQIKNNDSFRILIDESRNIPERKIPLIKS